MALGQFFLTRMFGLAEMRQLMRGRSVESPYPLTFEQVGHGYGFMLYETRITFDLSGPSLLKVLGIRDRGYVYLGDTLRGIVSRTEDIREVFIEPRKLLTLSILVENQGRINYGNFIADPKGIVENVTLGDRTLTGWTMTPIALYDQDWLRDATALEKVRRRGGDIVGISSYGLSVYGTTFALPGLSTAYDSFLRLNQWTKGVAFLNGFNLGRYWNSAGPQKTLYVPGVLFKKENNLLIIMELEVTRSRSPHHCGVEFVAEPEINGSVRWPL